MPAMQNKLYDSLEDAMKAKKLGFNIYGCKDCDFLFNPKFDSKKIKYSRDYDNTQENSLYFYKYLKDLAERLVKKYDLKNKSVIEIGCGKGGFLKLLYEGGVKNIKGFDPVYSNQDSLIDKLIVKKNFNMAENDCNTINIDNSIDRYLNVLKFFKCSHVFYGIWRQTIKSGLTYNEKY